LEWVASQCIVLTEEASSPPWTTEQLQDRFRGSVALCYQPACPPLVVEVDRAGDTSMALEDEADEVLEELVRRAPSPPRDQVIQHLRRSRFVVAIRIPTSVLGIKDEEALWRASHALLDYFVQHSRALVQADAEGFYEADTLILKMP
jgi:hypothetical protein